MSHDEISRHFSRPNVCLSFIEMRPWFEQRPPLGGLLEAVLVHLVEPVLRSLQQVGHDDDALLGLVELVDGRLQVEVAKRRVLLCRTDRLQVTRQQLYVVPQLGLRLPRLPDARVDGLDRGPD